MDSRHLKILQLLKEQGANNPTDISPLLLTMFPNISRMDSFEVRWAGSIIHQLLEDMKGQGWITVTPYVSLGSGNDTGGYTWLDIVHINASIKSKGIEVLEAELNKSDNEKLTASIIEANESNMETNRVVRQNISFQKIAQKWSIGLTISIAVSTLAYCIISGISLHYQSQSKSIQETLQRLDTTITNKSHRDSIFQQAVKDSLKIP